MARNDIDPRHLGGLPTATGGMTRLAYARARRAKVELGPLLQKSELTRQEIDDSDARISVRSQVRFLDLVANALHDNSLGFHLAEVPIIFVDRRYGSSKLGASHVLQSAWNVSAMRLFGR